MKAVSAIALAMAISLAGCGDTPSRATCFGFVQEEGPCRFTPVPAEPWEVAHDGVG